MARRAAATDVNQRAIVNALRKCGAAVQLLHTVGRGCPDLLVAFEGQNHLIEVKVNKATLSASQKVWAASWPAPIWVVHNPGEVLEFLRAVGRERQRPYKSAEDPTAAQRPATPSPREA